MALDRLRDWYYMGEKPEDFDGVYEYIQKHYAEHQEEAASRISDFNILRLSRVPWVDVRKYGATGDGSTDDTKAIQAAFTAAAGSDNNLGRVIIPTGTYVVTKIEVPSYLVIVIDGQLYAKDAINNWIFNIDTKTQVEIIGGHFNGNKAGSTGGGAVRVSASSFVKLQNLFITDCFSNAIYMLNSPTDCWVENCYIKDSGAANGLYIGGNSPTTNASRIQVVDNKFDSNGTGATTADIFLSSGVRDVVVSGNIIKDGTHQGIKFETDIEAVSIVNNVVRGSDAGGIVGGGGTPIKNVTIVGNVVSEVASSSSEGITVSATDQTLIDGITIDGNTLLSIGGYGINVFANRAIISNNNIQDIGTRTSSVKGIQIKGVDFIITGNTLKSTVEVDDGIESLTPSATGIIKNNRISTGFTTSLTVYGTDTIASLNLTEDSADIASAATVTLNPSGDFFNITGTTNITSVTASWSGREVALKFAGILTFTDGSNLKLAGNLVTTADDTITLVCDGTNWYETARSVN